MKNINQKLLIPIFAFIFLTSMIVIKISMPSYALEEKESNCDNRVTTFNAYIKDENGNEIAELTSTNYPTANFIVDPELKEYTVEVSLKFAPGSTKRNVIVTLQDGVKWVEYEKKGIITDIEEDSKKYYEIKGTNGKPYKYEIKSGTKTFEIDSISCGTFNFKIAADHQLRISDIANAITIEQQDGNGNNVIKKANVKNDFTDNYVKLEVNGYKLDNGVISATSFNPKGRLVGININTDKTPFIIKKLVIEVETPSNVTFAGYHPGTAGYSSQAIELGWEEATSEINPNDEEKKIYIFTYNDFLGLNIGLNPIWKIPKGESTENVRIKTKKIEYVLYDNSKFVYEFDDNGCLTEDNTKCFYQNYQNLTEEDIIVSANDVIDDFNLNKKYSAEIIRLGSVNIKNAGLETANDKTVNIKFDSTKIGVTHVSLPAVLGVRITNFKYKLKGNNNWITNFDIDKFEDPKTIADTHSTSLGYVNFTNEMIGKANAYITEVEYNVGKIPAVAETVYSKGNFLYSGRLIKQTNGTYPSEYQTIITVFDNGENPDECKNDIKCKTSKDGNYISKTIVGNLRDKKNYLSVCPRSENETQQMAAGDIITFKYYMWRCSRTLVAGTSTIKEPIIYIRIPKGLTIQEETIKIKTGKYKNFINDEYVQNITDYNLELFNNKNKTDENGQEYNVYKITFLNKPNTYIGYPQYGNSLYDKKEFYLKLEYDVKIADFYSDNGKLHYYYDSVFLTDASMDNDLSTNEYIIPEYTYEVNAPEASSGDPYNVDGDNKTNNDLMTYGVKSGKHYVIKPNPELNTYLSLKTKTEETNEVVIGEESAIVNVKIVNNSGKNNAKGNVYIPLPRKGDIWEGLMYCDEENKCNEYTYDLYLEEIIGDKDKYTISYGKNIKPLDNYEKLGVIDEIKWHSNKDLIDLSKDELKEINLIKITVSGMEKDEEINVEFKLYSDFKNKKEVIYNNISAASFRDLSHLEGGSSSWATTNFVNIGLAPSEEIIETPITASSISVIIMLVAIPTIFFGIYLIYKNTKEQKEKMDK